MQCSYRVESQLIRAHAHDWPFESLNSSSKWPLAMRKLTPSLVRGVCRQVTTPAETLVGSIEVGDLCQPWPRILCNRMEFPAVDNDYGDLFMDSASRKYTRWQLTQTESSRVNSFTICPAPSSSDRTASIVTNGIREDT
jgi:hypothetical protein